MGTGSALRNRLEPFSASVSCCASSLASTSPSEVSPLLFSNKRWVRHDDEITYASLLYESLSSTVRYSLCRTKTVGKWNIFLSMVWGGIYSSRGYQISHFHRLLMNGRTTFLIRVFPQVGTVKEGMGEFFSSRLTKKQRKKTLVDELLVADESFRYAYIERSFMRALPARSLMTSY